MIVTVAVTRCVSLVCLGSTVKEGQISYWSDSSFFFVHFLFLVYAFFVCMRIFYLWCVVRE